jgi:uncharacterized membrane protein YfcA
MFGGSISIAPALTPAIETPPLHLTATNSLVMFLSSIDGYISTGKIHIYNQR